MDSVFEIIDPCECGAESVIGAHGCTGGVVYSKHYCYKCYYGKEEKQEIGIIVEEMEEG